MKKLLFTVSLAFLGLTSYSQKIGKKHDVTTDHSSMFLEVNYHLGGKIANASFNSEIYGPLKTAEGKNMKFSSHAVLFQYLDKLGWKLHTKLHNEVGVNYFLFTREKK